MASVDNRVVMMGFKNEAFMDRLKETMRSLDNLKAKLSFSGDAKGLSDISTGMKNIDTSTVTAGIEGISNKFFAMRAVAFTVISDITQRFLSLGETLVKKVFSVDTIREGFKEFELNIGSIQTILANTASKGTTLSEVEAALDNLNTYSDKTIYNFAEMTKNIGTFTAAGVDLQTSVESIKGIANLAAISGSTSMQASTAMYQLSQAISTGTLRLMDWNSVTNAGMGGEAFKTALFETGKALGTITNAGVDTTFAEWEAANGSFRESLEKDWLSAEVLTTTLKAFTGEYDSLALQSMGYTEQQAQALEKLGQLGVDSATKIRTWTALVDSLQQSVVSGWATSFRTIVGDFNESTELFSFVNAMFAGWIGASSDARNKLLLDWKALGGRTKLFEGIGHVIHAVAITVTALKDAFHSVFPPMTGARLMQLTEMFENFTEKLIPSEATLGKFKDIATAVFTVLKLGVTIVKGVFSVFGALFGLFSSGDAAGGILSVAAAVARFVTSIANFLIEGIKFEKIGGAIVSFFTKIKTALAPLGQVFEAIGRAMQRLGAILRDAFATAWAESADEVEAAGDRMRAIFAKIQSALEDFASKAAAAIDGLFGGDGGGGSSSSSGPGKGGVMALLEQRLTGGSEGFASKLDGIKNLFAPLGDILANIRTFGKNVGDAIGEGDWDRLKSIIDKLLIGGVIASLLVFAKKLGDGFQILFRFKFEVSKSITEMLDGLTNTLQAMQLKLKADALKSIAVAIAILAGAALVLSLIPADNLSKAMAALAAGFAQMAAVLIILEKNVKGIGKLPAITASMNMMAVSMLVFAGAVALLGSMDIATLAKGIGSIALLLGAIVGFTKLIDENAEAMSRSSIGLLSFGIGLIFIAKAISKFGEMDLSTVIQGVLVLATTMTIITKTLQSMPPNMAQIGLGLLLVAVGLNVIAMAVQRMGSIPFGDLVKGIGGLVALLIPLSFAMNMMTGTLGGAAALLLTSVALVIFGKAIQTFAKIKFGDLVKGLLGIVAVLAVFGLAAWAMTPVIPVLLALGAALFLIGAGFALMGAGAYLVVRALEMLANIGAAGIDGMVKAARAAMELIPELLLRLAQGAIEFLRTILAAAPEFIKTIVTLVGFLLIELRKLIPQVIAFIIELIGKLLEALVALHGKLVEAGYQILMNILNGLRDHIGEIVTAVGEIIVEFLNAMTEELPRIIEAGVNLLVAWLEGIADAIEKIAPAVGAVITAFVDAVIGLHQTIIDAGVNVIVKFLEGIGQNTVKIVTAVGTVITDFITAIGANALRVVQAGVDTVLKFIDGLADNAIELADGAATVITDFLAGLRKVIDERGEELREQGRLLVGAVINGMTGGMAAKAKDVADGFVGMVKGGVDAGLGFLGIKSPSKLFFGIGQNVVEGFVMGLDKHDAVADAGERLAKAVVTATNIAITDTNPTITPVLDLSLVRAGARNIPGVLGVTSLAAAASVVDATTQTETSVVGSGGLNFTQIIHSPKPLTRAEIYRQTKSQLALAREELKA